MRASLLLMLGASLFPAYFAEETCTDGICVSDSISEDSQQYTVEVNSDGDTSSENSAIGRSDFWDSIDDVDQMESKRDSINPKEQAPAILKRMKKRSSERKQNKNGKNDGQKAKPVAKDAAQKIVVTPEMEKYFQDLIDSGGDHARLSVLSDLLSGTETSTPVEDMPNIILTDKKTADEHLRQSWNAQNEAQMKKDRKEEADRLDRLLEIFEQSLAAGNNGNSTGDAGAGSVVNLANMLEELFGGEEDEFENDNGLRDHTQKGFGVERNPCPDFEDSGKNGFAVPRMLHGYVDKNGKQPEEDTNLLSANGCSMLGDEKEADEFGLWKCCNRHDVCYGLCGSSLRFCERSFSTCMASTCDALDIGHDEASIIANQEACRRKKSEIRAFSRIFGSEMHSIEHENACTCVGSEQEAHQVHLGFLQDIYQRFGSSKKATNATLHENLLRKYKGMEAKLWYKLALKYGTQKGFVDFDSSPGADFGTASGSKIYTLEQLHEIRESKIEQAVHMLKRRRRKEMEEAYDNEITDEQQGLINTLRMATTAARRKYETLRENHAAPPTIPRVVDLK